MCYLNNNYIILINLKIFIVDAFTQLIYEITATQTVLHNIAFFLLKF